jgi:CheY-like chemotaxis protein
MKTVLLIDDDEMFRRVARLALHEFGYAVTEAADGKAGLAAYLQQPADVVITDLIMPEQEGIETIIALRKANPAVKIVAISGGGRGSADGYLHTAAMFGADRVLQKPFLIEALVAALRSLQPEA